MLLLGTEREVLFTLDIDYDCTLVVYSVIIIGWPVASSFDFMLDGNPLSSVWI